ncbi:unnamed protein product [Amoebophrya sp. A25]|nr:unnamed protein product [Amoebophrya sp. A25]|eukprot:GSA25T00008603001.1
MMQFRVSSLAKNLFERQQGKLRERKKTDVTLGDVLEDEIGLETLELPRSVWDCMGLACKFTTVNLQGDLAVEVNAATRGGSAPPSAIDASPADSNNPQDAGAASPMHTGGVAIGGGAATSSKAVAAGESSNKKAFVSTLLPRIVDINRKNYQPMTTGLKNEPMYGRRTSTDGRGAGTQMIQSAVFFHGQRVIVPDSLVVEPIKSGNIELYDHVQGKHVDFEDFIHAHGLQRTVGFDPPVDELVAMGPKRRHNLATEEAADVAEKAPKVDRAKDGEEPPPSLFTRRIPKPKSKFEKPFIVGKDQPPPTPEDFIHFEMFKPVARIKFRQEAEDGSLFDKEIVYQSSHVVNEVSLGWRLEVKDFDIKTNVDMGEDLMKALDSRAASLGKAGTKNSPTLGSPGGGKGTQSPISASISSAAAAAHRHYSGTDSNSTVLGSAVGVDQEQLTGAQLAAWKHEEEQFARLLREIFKEFFFMCKMEKINLRKLEPVYMGMSASDELKKTLFSDMDGRTCRNGHLMTAIPCHELRWTRPAACIQCRELTTYKVITCAKRCEISGYCIGCESDDEFHASLRAYCQEADAKKQLEQKLEDTNSKSNKQIRLLGTPVNEYDMNILVRFLVVTKIPYREQLDDPWIFETQAVKELSQILFPGQVMDLQGQLVYSCHPQIMILNCSPAGGASSKVVMEVVLVHPRVGKEIIPRTRHFRGTDRSDAIDLPTSGRNNLVDKFNELSEWVNMDGSSGMVDRDDTSRFPIMSRSLRTQMVSMLLARGKLETVFPVRADVLTYNFKTRLRTVTCQDCKKPEIEDRTLKHHKETECLMRKIRCSQDCGAMILARDDEDHRFNHCANRAVYCPLCNGPVVLHQVDAHVENCEYRPWTCPLCDMHLKVKDMESHKLVCANRQIECNWCGEMTIFYKLVPEHKKRLCCRRQEKAEELRDRIFAIDHEAVAALLDDGVAPTLDANDATLVDLGIVSTQGMQLDGGNSLNTQMMGSSILHPEHQSSMMMTNPLPSPVGVSLTETNVPLVSRPGTRDVGTRVYMGMESRTYHDAQEMQERAQMNEEVTHAHILIASPSRGAARGHRRQQRPGDDAIISSPERLVRPESRANNARVFAGTSPNVGGAAAGGAHIASSPESPKGPKQDFASWYDEQGFSQMSPEHEAEDAFGKDSPHSPRTNSGKSQFSRIQLRKSIDDQVLTSAFDSLGLALPVRHYTLNQPSGGCSVEMDGGANDHGATMKGEDHRAAGGVGTMPQESSLFEESMLSQHNDLLDHGANKDLQHNGSLALSHDGSIALDINFVEKESGIENKPGRHLYAGLGLHSAVQAGDLETLRMVCEQEEMEVDLHIRDSFGCTALHLAAMRGRLDMVDLLLQTEWKHLDGKSKIFASTSDPTVVVPVGGRVGLGEGGSPSKNPTAVSVSVSSKFDEQGGGSNLEALQSSTEQYNLQKLRELKLPRIVDHTGRTPLFVAAFHRRRAVAERLYAITIEETTPNYGFLPEVEINLENGYEEEEDAAVRKQKYQQSDYLEMGSGLSGKVVITTTSVKAGDEPLPAGQANAPPDVPSASKAAPTDSLGLPVGMPAVQQSVEEPYPLGIAKAGVTSATHAQPHQATSTGGPSSASSMKNSPQKQQPAQNKPLRPGQVIKPSHMMSQYSHTQSQETFDESKIVRNKESDAYWQVVDNGELAPEPSTQWQKIFTPNQATQKEMKRGFREYKELIGMMAPGDVSSSADEGEVRERLEESRGIYDGNLLRYGSESFLRGSSRHSRDRQENILNEGLRDTISLERYDDMLANHFLESSRDHTFQHFASSHVTLQDPMNAVPSTEDLLSVHVRNGMLPTAPLSRGSSRAGGQRSLQSAGLSSLQPTGGGSVMPQMMSVSSSAVGAVGSVMKRPAK